MRVIQKKGLQAVQIVPLIRDAEKIEEPNTPIWLKDADLLEWLKSL